MAAITWRQLVSPDDSGAFHALRTAGETFNSGFDAVNKAIASRQTANQYQEDLGRKTNVAAYLDAVQQANTPEAAAALQADPRMQALGASVDPRDRDLVRNAIETRLASTRQNVTAGQTFQADQLLQQHLPTLNEAKAAYARGDQANGDRLMGTVPTNVRDYATAISAGMKDVEARKKFADDILTAGVTRDATKSNAAAATSNAESAAINAAANTKNAETQAGQLKVHQDEAGLRSQEALEKRLTSLNESVAAHTPGLTTPTAQKAISDFIKSLPEGDQTRMQVAISKLSNNKKYSGMSVGDAIAAARDTVDVSGEGVKKWLWNSTGDSIESAADKILADPNYQANQQLRKDALDSVTLQRDVLKQSLYPKPPKPAAEPSNPGVAVPTTAPTQSTPSADPQQALMDKRIRLEEVKIALGELKDYSPEVQQYINEQNRQGIETGTRAVGAAATKLGAAATDIVTLPLRGVMGAINDVISIPNAFGANIPTIPDKHGVLSSMTPYFDMLKKESSREDLIKQRIELERSIKEESKKAK